MNRKTKRARVKENSLPLFQPDTIFVLEDFDAFRRKTHLEPERRLLLAVLEDAIACFQKDIDAPEGRRSKTFREAEEWFLERDSERLFSFENTCEAIGINPSYLRQGLFRWKEIRMVRQVSICG